MKKLLPLLLLVSSIESQAQVVSCASFLRPTPRYDVVVPFRYADTGVTTPMEWGLDVAWLSESNVRTGVFFAGKDLIDIMRVSFRPTESVEEGALSDDQLSYVKQRGNIVKKWCKPSVTININSDPGDGSETGVNAWYNESSVGSAVRGQRWAKCIDLHIDAYKNMGVSNLVSISPFNEPDYGWGQGTNSTRKADFLATAKSLREDYGGKYDGIRISGGNTLNDDKAYEWWNYLKAYLDEGNTHQLAGDFAHYADFFTTVREAGHHATADELHNTMEAMVGVEYGLQTGIWWGTAEYTRSQFMKATYWRNPGTRLGYAEHRDNWTAASVYRQTDGTVQGFGGTSERQAVATKFNFVSLDQPVWYDGVRGRDFLMDLPGGTGYQKGQTNAETLVNIQGGDDVMPHIDGTYKVVNVNSGLPMGFSATPSGWTSVAQRKNSNYKYLQWKVTPVEKSGDYAYYCFTLNAGTNIYLDIKDWNYNAGAEVGGFAGGLGTNEQWYLQYAGNGAFYIRSRYSTKCLEVVDGKTTAGAIIKMAELNGSPAQQWRFLATTVTPDLVAPDAPMNLQAQPQPASVRLTWDACTSKDLSHYVVVRNGIALAKGFTECEFVDNEAYPDSVYSYSVYAVDKSLNYSEHSNVVKDCKVTGEKAEIAHLSFDEDFNDQSVNGNHCTVFGDTAFVESNGHRSLKLSGTNNFIQLPYTIANHDEMTVSCWLYYRGGDSWQRIFDFGNDENQYMFLTANTGSGLRFAIKNNGSEQRVDAGSLKSFSWHHVAVTMGNGTVRIYVDGVLKGENTNVTIKPSDIRPVFNYIGRSQFSADPYFKGNVDDVIIYNYALDEEEVKALTVGIENIEDATEKVGETSYNLSGRRSQTGEKGIALFKGKKVVR